MAETRSAPPASSSNVSGGHLAFQAAARTVLRRLVTVKWLGLLGRGAVPVFVAASGVIVASRLLGARWSELWAALALVLGWVIAAAVWAWLGRPSAVEALAVWDRRARREEMFVSAYCFELESRAVAGEKLHLARALRRLREELSALRRDLPASLAPRAWILPLAFLGFAGTGLFRARVPAEEAPLSAEAREHARKVGETLAGEAKLLDPLKGLTPEERRRAEELESGLGRTARKLRKLEGVGPREILDELERRAREAERIAEELDCGEGDVLSSDVIAELERHADTSEFASALRAGDSCRIAEEAGQLADRLRREGLTIEERERIRNALEKALRVASDADKRSLLGRRLSQAHKHLQRKRRRLAARDFSDISRNFERAWQRQQSRRQLERLAESLRCAGQRILGRNPAGMRRLARNSYPGLQSVGSQRKALPLGPWLAARMPVGAGASARWGLPCSGATPGTGRTPVPGTGTGGARSGLGQIPVPGAGGLQAGHGSAPYGETPSARLETSSTGVVDPLVSGEGPSMVRSIEGRARAERAQRVAQELAIEFIRSEEEALSEEPLPLSRREQVLRYFTALRGQIEREH